MIQFLEKINLRQDNDRIKILFWAVFALLALALFTKAFIYNNLILNITKIVILVFYFNFTWKTLKRYYYTYWTMSGFLVVYLLYGLYESIFILSHYNLVYIHLLALIFISVQMYVLYSPIYYPMVSWWEYDFRYRTDLKMDVEFEGERFESRIVDLRRSALGIQSFKSFTLGEKVKIVYETANEEISFNCEIVSKRSYSIGRPYMYGLKIYENLSERSVEYDKLLKEWHSKKRLVRQQKFSKDVLN